MNVKVCPDCGTYNPEDAWTCMGRSCVAILSVADIVELREPQGQAAEPQDLADAVSGNGNGSGGDAGSLESDLLDADVTVGPPETLVAVEAPEPEMVAEVPDMLEVPVTPPVVEVPVVPEVAEVPVASGEIEVIEASEPIAVEEAVNSELIAVEEAVDPEPIMVEEAVEAAGGADHPEPVDSMTTAEETPSLDELLDALETDPVDSSYAAATPEAPTEAHVQVVPETAFDTETPEAAEPETVDPEVPLPELAGLEAAEPGDAIESEDATEVGVVAEQSDAVEPEDVIEPEDAGEAVAAAQSLSAPEIPLAVGTVAAVVSIEDHESIAPDVPTDEHEPLAPTTWAVVPEPVAVRSGEPTLRATSGDADRAGRFGLHLRDVSGSGRAVFVLSVVMAVAGMVFLLAGVVGGPTDTMRMAPVLLGLGCVMLAVVLALWGIAEQLGRLWTHIRIVEGDLRRET